MEKINYIVAGYPGPHSWHKYNNQNKFFYGDHFIKHLLNLEKLQHNLEAITVVINDFNEGPKWQIELFERFIEDYAKRNPIAKIIRRSNHGLSYSGYLQAFETRDQDYDNYILMECDYSFCTHNFDTKLSDLQKRKGLDAMFALWAGIGGNVAHGAISLAIINHKSFLETFNKFHGSMHGHQINFTTAFYNAGFKCGDWRDTFKVEFYDHPQNKMLDFSLPSAREKIYQYDLVTE